MKKLLSVLGILSFLISFGQVNSISQMVGTVTGTGITKITDKNYNGGNEQFLKDVKDNFTLFASEYQVNGKFIINFNLDENGEIADPKIYPKVEQNFNFALIRAFKRMKSNFKAVDSTKNLAVLLDFDFKINSDDAKADAVRFTSTTPRMR